MRGIRRIHFVGAGGIGMCGLAELLANQGYAVSGSDLRDGPNTERLRSLGIDVHIGTPRSTWATPTWWSTPRPSAPTTRSCCRRRRPRSR